METGIEPVCTALQAVASPLGHSTAGLMPLHPRADDGIRTRDPHLGKVMRYQLRYIRALRPSSSSVAMHDDSPRSWAYTNHLLIVAFGGSEQGVSPKAERESAGGPPPDVPARVPLRELNRCRAVWEDAGRCLGQRRSDPRILGSDDTRVSLLPRPDRRIPVS